MDYQTVDTMEDRQQLASCLLRAAAVTRGQTCHFEYSINMEVAAIVQTISDRVCFIISQLTEQSLRGTSFLV